MAPGFRETESQVCLIVFEIWIIICCCCHTRHNTNERTLMLLVPIDSYFQLECVENYYLNLVLRLKFDFIFIFCFSFLFSFNFFLPILCFSSSLSNFFPLLIFFHWFVGMVQQVPHLKSKTVRFFIFKIKSIVEPMKKNETCNNSDNSNKKERQNKKPESTICRFKMWKSQTALFSFTCDAIESDDVNRYIQGKNDAIWTDYMHATLLSIESTCLSAK